MYDLKKAFSNHFELIFWVSGMVALVLSDPTKTHYVLCPLKLMGFTWCPGCGLGHAISYLFHGELSSSFKAHWLGVPAVLIIARRIYVLFLKLIVTFR